MTRAFCCIERIVVRLYRAHARRHIVYLTSRTVSGRTVAVVWNSRATQHPKPVAAAPQPGLMAIYTGQRILKHRYLSQAPLMRWNLDLRKGLKNLRAALSVPLSEDKTKLTIKMSQHMSPSLENSEGIGTQLPTPILSGSFADANTSKKDEDSSDSESIGSTLVFDGHSLNEDEPRVSSVSPLPSSSTLWKDVTSFLPDGPESNLDVARHYIHEARKLSCDNLRFPSHSSLATLYLPSIIRKSHISRPSANVVPAFEHSGIDQTLVALHDVDGIIYFEDMRLEGRNLECNNTSPALDHTPRADSGRDANKHKSTPINTPAPAMPALLAFDDTPCLSKAPKPITRLIGVPPPKPTHHRKSAKSRRRASSAVSLEVKRISLEHDPDFDVWQTEEQLGEGTYGRVFRVCNKVGTELAMKVVDISVPLPSILVDGLINELSVLEILSYERERLPYLLCPTNKRSWAWRTSDRLLCILTEFCPGGQLMQHVGRLTGTSLRQILAELVVGIDSLHRLGIVHHDLKPENILIDADGHCVISDFGSAKFLDQDGFLSLNVHDDVLTTLPYAAPEIISADCDKNGIKYYDESVDWWALGVIIMTLIIGEEYFQGKSMAEVSDNIPFYVERIHKTLRSYRCSETLIDLVEGLLTEDPTMRFRISDIKNHPYFSKVDWPMVEERSPDLLPPFFPGSRNIDPIRPVDKRDLNWPRLNEDGYDFVEELRAIGLDLKLDDSIEVPI
ncbi:hypothetical protein NM688_g284 [Phlebia brevispora]|uniref:Uncharacterized protein n=1 Tax=Phlebia brevispora TaxID=194682 RepID=A0ACC1TES2_9APHY|nr:hypothetical protein NM688_g284 [Phlebia brevispora]